MYPLEENKTIFVMYLIPWVGVEGRCALPEPLPQMLPDSYSIARLISCHGPSRVHHAGADPGFIKGGAI